MLVSGVLGYTKRYVMRQARRTKLVPSQVPIPDLLYAHAMLCDWARGRPLEKLLATRHCEVLNNYHRVLRAYLIPNAPSFEVIGAHIISLYFVQPIGGWTYDWGIHKGG